MCIRDSFRLASFACPGDTLPEWADAWYGPRNRRCAESPSDDIKGVWNAWCKQGATSSASAMELYKQVWGRTHLEPTLTIWQRGQRFREESQPTKQTNWDRDGSLLDATYVCVSHSVSRSLIFKLQSAVGYPSHQWWMATEEARAANVPGDLIRATDGNGTRHACVSAPFLLLFLF